MTRPALLLAAALLPLCASAHEVLHAVERERAIAVRAYLPDGEGLAYADYEVFSPADASVPHQRGRTDRAGWLAFVPDAPGPWRVKVMDSAGHGLELSVDAAAPALPASAATSPWAFALRPLVGVLAIGAVFAALLALHRRKATRR